MCEDGMKLKWNEVQDLDGVGDGYISVAVVKLISPVDK
jgi:hypothetical protein